MTNPSILKIVLVSCMLIGCSSDNPSMSITDVSTLTNQDDHTYYEQVLAPGIDCTNDGIFNCTADLYLCKDGSAFLLLTDIINSGTYVEVEGKIESQWGFGDVPSQIDFVKQADLSVIDNSWGFTWNKTVSESTMSWCDN